jgi:hypothetical protein
LFNGLEDDATDIHWLFESCIFVPEPIKRDLMTIQGKANPNGWDLCDHALTLKEITA